VERVALGPIWIIGVPECLERDACAEKSNDCCEELQGEADEDGAVYVYEGSAGMAPGYTSVEQENRSLDCEAGTLCQYGHGKCVL